MIKKIILFVCTFILISIAPSYLFSVSVDWVSGDVTYSHLKSEWRALNVGTQLAPGDIVKTGTYSEVTLIDDGVEIYLLENSTFTISEKYEDEQQKTSLMLFLGRMKFKLSRARKTEPEIRTQTVNLTIRGTEFEVGSGFDGSTLVLLSDGVVSVRGKTKELVLEGGEGTEIAFGEEPTEKFELITRVIDWNEWFIDTKESVKGNELLLLNKILERFQEIDGQIKEYERMREEARARQKEHVETRDRLREEGRDEEAVEYSRKAGAEGKAAYHLLMNIRFLALSCIGLHDLALDIFKGVEKPDAELKESSEQINEIYGRIERSYIYEGDREALEKRARKKKGCLKLF